MADRNEGKVQIALVLRFGWWKEFERAMKMGRMLFSREDGRMSFSPLSDDTSSLDLRTRKQR